MGDARDGAGRDWARLFNGALRPEPLKQIACRSTEELSQSLRLANQAGTPVSILNGGQDWEGRGVRDGTIVLDISALKGITIDVARCEAEIGGGVTVGELNQAAGAAGLAATLGNDGAISVAGLALGGGYGPLITRFGLACDNLVGAEVVMPDGEIRACDASREPDLFWALRGGGGNFGVVSRLRVRLHAIAPVQATTMVFPWPDAPRVLARYADLMQTAPEELFGAAVLAEGPGGRPAVVISLIWSGEVAQGEAHAAEMRAAGTPVLAKTDTLPADRILGLTDGKLVQGLGYAVATRWFSTLAPEAIAVLLSAFEQRKSPAASIVLHHCHGAATAVAHDATAFGMRQPHFTALIYGAWQAGEGDAAPHRLWTQNLDRALAPHSLPGGYANILSDAAGEQIPWAYGSNGPRIAELKERFDPTAMFAAIPLPPDRRINALPTDRDG